VYTKSLKENAYFLLYGLETCPLKKADIRSLDFLIDRLLIKLFRTNNMNTVRQCQQFFNFNLPSIAVVNRVAKFESQFCV